MNLQYIEKKKDQMKYTSFNEYFADVELMIDNALKFNHQQTSPYHKAALRLQKLHEKLKKRIWKAVAEMQKKDTQR
jgi:Bromodomain